MTGIYVRVQTDDGSWESLELDRLSDSELERFITMKEKQDDKSAWNWVKTLARWIRDNVREERR